MTLWLYFLSHYFPFFSYFDAPHSWLSLAFLFELFFLSVLFEVHVLSTKSDLVVFTKRIHWRCTDVAFGEKKTQEAPLPAFLLVFRLQPTTTHDCGITNACRFQLRAKAQSPQPWFTVQYIHVHVLYMWLPNLTSRSRCHCLKLWCHFLFSGLGHCALFKSEVVVFWSRSHGI